MELFIFSGKRPSWYIIFVKLVNSVSPASPDATSISVNILSGPGAYYICLPGSTDEITNCFIWANKLIVIFPY